jgi:ketopantoate reductase
VLLTMKSQDTAPALDELSRAADPDVTVVCAQNGIENERLALRRFERVYGMFVFVSAQLLEPAVIQVFSAPTLGVLDLGRMPPRIPPRCDGRPRRSSASRHSHRWSGMDPRRSSVLFAA